MSTELLLKYSDMAFIALCFGIIVLMGRKRLLTEFPLLACLLSLEALGGGIALAILFFRQPLGIEIHAA